MSNPEWRLEISNLISKLTYTNVRKSSKVSGIGGILNHDVDIHLPASHKDSISKNLKFIKPDSCIRCLWFRKL